MANQHTKNNFHDPADVETVPRADGSVAERLRNFLQSKKHRPSDDLEDYSGNFQSFVPLGSIVTSDMKHQQQRPERDLKPDSPGAGAGKTLDTAVLQGGNYKIEKSSTEHPTSAWGSEGRFVSLLERRCVHGFSCYHGCSECVRICPEKAISMGKEIPEIDHGVCSGCGVCITACPTDALQRQTGNGVNLIFLISSAISGALQKGLPPALVIHDQNEDAFSSDQYGHAPAVSLKMDQIGFVDMTAMLSAVALGAVQVKVLVDNHNIRRSITERIEAEVHRAQAVLQVLGLSRHRLLLTADTGAPDNAATVDDGIAVAPATYSMIGSSRTLLYRAINHLMQQANVHLHQIPLPKGASYGGLKIEEDRCTVCMACVSACKVAALAPMAGQTPGFVFTEKLCVQCGLCAEACPEQAITLHPRIHLGSEANAPSTIVKSEPERCISCGKVMGVPAMVAAIQSKLANHWMYRDDNAKQALHMCGMCRASYMIDQVSHWKEPS